MNLESFTKPVLIEPGVKYFLNETLKQCRDFKNKYNNLLINVSLFLFFILILGAILIYKYKGKLTPQEKIEKTKEKQQYILSKIKMLQEEKKRAHQEIITGLPNFSNDYEPLPLNF
jgi:hypothetical protein